MISGISHITFIVKNLEKTSHLLKELFNAQEVYKSGDKFFSNSKEKFFMICEIWIAIMEGEPLKEKTYNHIAFKIDENDYEDYICKIKNLELTILEGRKRISGEGKSIYFYDYDNHLFELHTGNLNERLSAYNQISK